MLRSEAVTIVKKCCNGYGCSLANGLFPLIKGAPVRAAVTNLSALSACLAIAKNYSRFLTTGQSRRNRHHDG